MRGGRFVGKKNPKTTKRFMEPDGGIDRNNKKKGKKKKMLRAWRPVRTDGPPSPGNSKPAKNVTISAKGE